MFCLKAVLYKLHELKIVCDYTLFSSISDLFFSYFLQPSPLPLTKSLPILSLSTTSRPPVDGTWYLLTQWQYLGTVSSTPT